MYINLKREANNIRFFLRFSLIIFILSILVLLLQDAGTLEFLATLIAVVASGIVAIGSGVIIRLSK